MEKFTSEVAEATRAFLEGEEVKAAIEATTKAADTETGTFEVVITTADLDRYQEVISLDGWELDHYLRNPVVLWGHDHSKLIGVATSVEKHDGKLIAKGKFAPTDEGQEKRKLYEMGFLKATSVGFIEKERQGNLITKAELLEFSFVSVPANPHALSLAMERELNINELVTKGIFTIKETPVAEADPNEVPAADEEDVESGEKKQKGAVAEEVAAQDAWEQKWRNFSQVDDVIYSFWKVYFDKETPVDQFGKLLDETLGILKQVANGTEKLQPTANIKEILKAPVKGAPKALEHLKAALSALEALDTEELERTEDEPGAETEEQRALDEFNENRRILQRAATILGDVLAEKRQEAEARR